MNAYRTEYIDTPAGRYTVELHYDEDSPNPLTDWDVCGFITKSPDGELVESVWGFYDDDEALQEGITAAECDAADRVDAANHAGAGFVGVV